MKAYIGSFNSTHYVFTDIQIEPHDTWSLDITLARIILPALQQFKINSKATPLVYRSDLPEELWKQFKCTNTSSDHNTEAWNWILDQMINSFDLILKDNIDPTYLDVTKPDTVQVGLNLFAKYYRCLWD